jgi:hypothetical protein
MRSAFDAAPVEGFTAEIVAGIVLRAGPIMAAKANLGDEASIDAIVAALLRTVGIEGARAALVASKAADEARADVGSR